MQTALLVKGHNYEDLRGKEQSFRQLEQAIVARHQISFSYRKADAAKDYVDIEPYKLVNHKGIWYLATKDLGKLKTFAFSKIDRLLVSDMTFKADHTVERTLVDDEGIWLGKEKQEIVLKVAKEVAAYFKRRKLIANQVVEKELEDGALILSTIVGHSNQIVPIVRYWIPHIRIISPEALQIEMRDELAKYLKH